MVGAAGNTPDTKFLELAKVFIYGSEVYALMDSGAMPNVMSKALFDRLSVMMDNRIGESRPRQASSLPFTAY